MKDSALWEWCRLSCSHRGLIVDSQLNTSGSRHGRLNMCTLNTIQENTNAGSTDKSREEPVRSSTMETAMSQLRPGFSSGSVTH
jgi:hypothetical protein